MSLQEVPFWESPLNAQLATTSGHPCLMRGNSCDTRHTRALRNGFVLGSYLLAGIGMARALSSCSEAAGIWWPRRTPQPTSSERPRAQKTRAAHSVVCGPCLPLASL